MWSSRAQRAARRGISALLKPYLQQQASSPLTSSAASGPLYDSLLRQGAAAAAVAGSAARQGGAQAQHPLILGSAGRRVLVTSAARQAAAAAPASAAEAAPKKVKISVNGIELETDEGKTILQACRDHNIYIPAICFHPSLKPVGTCRLCLVDAGGYRLEPACVKQVSEGMTVFTKNQEINDTIKGNLSLMRLKHPNVCSTCSACNHCEFQDLLLRYDVDDSEVLHKKPRVNPSVEAQGVAHAHDESSPALQFDFDKCILCLRCVRACSELQGMNVLGPMARGESETVAPLFALPLNQTACLSCGACVAVCPVAAITEKPQYQEVRELLEAGAAHGAEVSRARLDELIPLDENDRRVLWGPLPGAKAQNRSYSTSAASTSMAPYGAPGKRTYSTSTAAVAEVLENVKLAGPSPVSGTMPFSTAAEELVGGAEKKKRPPVIVVQTAPAVRVTISEAFGMDPGAISTGQMVTALKQLGFHYVFDVNFSADLTIMEEATELLHRLKDGGPFPMYTSCCPGWINMVEKTYPELIPHLSTCKSPQQMLGAVVKTYFASAIGRDPDEVKVVSVMPCVAKKDEAQREEHKSKATGLPDIDYVLTTRELAKLIETHRPRIHFANLKPTEFDNPLGESSGAALLFGVTGGVMEAALRTAVAVTAPPGSPTLPRINFQEVRGLQGVRDATVDVNGTELRVAIANGGANLRRLVDSIQEGKAPEYHFIEMMACRGGCIGGAGNPKDSVDDKLLQHRAAAVYHGDQVAAIRESHNNLDISELYKKFLGEPNGHLAHELLHTHYKKRDVMGTGIYFPDTHGMIPNATSSPK